MKSIILALAAALALSVSPAFARGHSGSYSPRSYSSHPAFTYAGSGRESRSVEHVRSYTRRSGTVVQPHDRTTADGTQTDNWSARGNRNLETGKWGSKPATH